MKTGQTVLASLIIVLGMAAMAAWAMTQLGPQHPVATHFGVNGPDRFMPASIGLWAHPVGALALTAVFALLPRIMPRRAPLERSAGAYRAVWLSVLLIMAAVEAVAVAQALGAPVAAPDRLVPGAVGLLTLILGNLMGKIRYNYVFGVRTPWTLADERVWDRTHRFIGPWCMLWGAATFGAALFAPEGAARIVLIAGAVGLVALSLAYSYLAARRLGDA